MKNLFTLFAMLLLLAAWSCGSGGDEVVSPDNAYISLSKENVVFSPDGESIDIKVYSNYVWELTNQCDWVTVSVTSGGANEQGTTITLTADLTYDDREGTILFSCGKAKRVLGVSQSFKETIITDENNTFHVPTEGGTVEIAYQTTVECEIVIPQNAQSWISLASDTRGLVSETATLNVAKNTEDERSAVVKVVAVNNSELMAEYTISQETSYCIQYTTLDDEVISMNEKRPEWLPLPFGDANIVSNTYQNGVGVIVFDRKLVEIADMAFSGCTTLTSITIPDSVTSIGEGVFYGCTSLTSFSGRYASEDGRCLIIDGVLNSFAQAGLTEYTIPDGVTSIGVGVFYGCTSLKSVTIPDSVTTIGDSAFGYCTSLTSFSGKYASEDGRCLIIDGVLHSFAPADLTEYTIPDRVTTIGVGAFEHCTSLTSITIPDSVTEIRDSAFWSCTSLTSITIPDSVTWVGYDAFAGLTNLASVYFKPITPPNDCLYFDSDCEIYVPYENLYAYKFCCPLSEKVIPYDYVKSEIVDHIENRQIRYTSADDNIVEPYNTWAFGANMISNNCAYGVGTITFDGAVTSLGQDVFQNCDNLTSITIPDSASEIGGYAFRGCTSLTSITIPDSVTSIGRLAFGYCSSLTNMTIPDSVTGIGDCAFINCPLISITIPDSVTSIGVEAFSGCTSLESVTIGNGVTEIGVGVFFGCSSLTSITIPDSVTSIGRLAFVSCTSLTSFSGKYASEDGRCLIIDGVLNSVAQAGLTEYTIPDGVTSIGVYAFYSCTSLKSVTIPDSVTTIGDSAFENCTSLTSVTIPDRVTTISDLAFYRCTSLKSVHCKPTTPPKVGHYSNSYSYVFDDNASDRKIYVPTQSVDAYKNADGWEAYASDIVGYY